MDSIGYSYSISDCYGMDYLGRIVKLKSEPRCVCLPIKFCRLAIKPVNQHAGAALAIILIEKSW